MNYKYILREIKKANEYSIEAFDNLNEFNSRANNKYLEISKDNIIEINEILSNLEIDIEMIMEDNSNE